YDTAMNIAYEIDSKNLGCRALEEKLKQSYQYAPIETTVDKDSVQLLTYHKSKGLEWPIVILPFIYRERKLSSADQSEIDNEKRMLFVACTRAKHRLILIDDSSCSPNTNHSNMISSGKFLDGII
ncbi:MAG: ATP-binding domain-containing protein, partial [Opitutales bacterium]|nr:ATP-binding domain-containing protein [Opitutales bacterium]